MPVINLPKDAFQMGYESAKSDYTKPEGIYKEIYKIPLPISEFMGKPINYWLEIEAAAKQGGYDKIALELAQLKQEIEGFNKKSFLICQSDTNFI